MLENIFAILLIFMKASITSLRCSERYGRMAESSAICSSFIVGKFNFSEDKNDKKFSEFSGALSSFAFSLVVEAFLKSLEISLVLLVEVAQNAALQKELQSAQRL